MMLVTVLALTVLAVALVTVSPWLLTRGTWHVKKPRVALALWCGAVLMGTALAITAVALSLPVAIGGQLVAPVEAIALSAFCWAAIALFAAGLAVAGATSERWGEGSSLRERQLLRAELPQLRIGDEDVLVVDEDAPSAWSIGGVSPVILVTSGALDLLTPAQLRAVVAHERAHLTGGHHVIRGLAALQWASIPWLPAARHLNRSSRLLVELIADDHAARRAGAVHLANALAKFGDASGDPVMALRAERLAARAWLPGRGAVQDRRLRPARP